MSHLHNGEKFKYKTSAVSSQPSKKNKNSNPSLLLSKRPLGKPSSQFFDTSPFKSKNSSLSLYQKTNNNKPISSKYKKTNNNKLKYNRSFEGKFLTNASEEVLSNEASCATIGMKDDIYSMYKDIKYVKMNNSVILSGPSKNYANIHKNNKNKSINVNTKLIITNNNISKKTKKIEDKIKSLENDIIDKKYENDIDNDEMIITTNTNTNNKQNLLLFNNNNANANSNNIENNSSAFNKFKIDFDLRYSKYDEEKIKKIRSEMLAIEIKLLIEKMSVLQNSYHNEMDEIILNYNNDKQEFRALIENIKQIQKKIHLLRKFLDKMTIENNLGQNLNLHEIKATQGVNKSFLENVNIWKNIMSHNYDEKNDFYKGSDKEKIVNIFRTVVINKNFNYNFHLNNNKEKLEKLVKKYKIKNDVNSNNSNDNEELTEDSEATSNRRKNNRNKKKSNNNIFGVSGVNNFNNKKKIINGVQGTFSPSGFGKTNNNVNVNLNFLGNKNKTKKIYNKSKLKK